MSERDRVGVIDIGSNSIKCLVAEKDSAGLVKPVFQKTIETRIGTGISSERPCISEKAVGAGIEAVKRLHAEVAEYRPTAVKIAATSAVRDASNKAEFSAQVEKATGVPLTVLSGEEEASYIARGLIQDPELKGAWDMTLFDLGGGSLEYVYFRDGEVHRAVSLQLGAVRITELFIKESSDVVHQSTLECIWDHCFKVMSDAGIPRQSGDVVVGLGGGFAVSRMILGEQKGVSGEDTPPELPLPELQTLLHKVARQTLGGREKIPGLPASRADIYPAALAITLAVGDYVGATRFVHSFYNLKFGVAAELLHS